jgi:hypothetical protein
MCPVRSVPMSQTAHCCGPVCAGDLRGRLIRLCGWALVRTEISVRTRATAPPVFAQIGPDQPSVVGTRAHRVGDSSALMAPPSQVEKCPPNRVNSTSRQASLHLRAAVDRRSSPPASGEHGAAVPAGRSSSCVWVENRSQRQRRRYRQRRVARLAVARGAGLGLPRRNRRFREPDGQAPALAQGDVIGGPIRHSVPLLRDVMTAILVRFEWHGDCPGSEQGP